MGIEQIFKPEILNSGGYKGGKSRPSEDGKREIFKLSSNENLNGSSPSVVKKIEKRANHLNIYPSTTPQPLYEALYSHYHGQLTTDQFIAGNGGSDLLQLITRAFLDASTNCIISNPCFAPYMMFSSWTGASVKDVPLKGEELRLDVQGILDSIDHQTRLIFLTSPNNPTGTYIRKSELEELINKIPQHIVIIYDEVYHHFVDAPDYTRALPYVQKGAPIVAINSFSKAYGLAGLRIGYGYTTPSISSYLRKLIRPFLINDLSLQAAISALKDQHFIHKTVLNNQIQRTRLAEGLKKLKLKFWPSQSNFILVKTNMDEIKLSKHMQDQGVMVRPSGNFGASKCIRITIGTKAATDATLTALATILT